MATYKTSKAVTGKVGRPVGEPGMTETRTPSGSLADSSPATLAQQRLQRLADTSPRAVQLKRQAGALAASPVSATMEHLQSMANTSPRALQFERSAALTAVDGPSSHAARSSATSASGPAPAQRMADQADTQGDFNSAYPAGVSSAAPVQLERKPNRTGLPDRLKAGIESLSGINMDHVRVHYNSAKPAQLQAHAFAQGSEIHVASGQERHLPHEAWHVVQQAQGRVRPTLQMKTGVAVNDDTGLESEANRMGVQAARFEPGQRTRQFAIFEPSLRSGRIAQLQTKIVNRSGPFAFGGSNYEVGIEMEAVLDADHPLRGRATGPMTQWGQQLNMKYGGRVVRGHLLNHDLGGDGAPANLFPISEGANHRHSMEVEQKVKAELNQATDSLPTAARKPFVAYQVSVVRDPAMPESKATFHCRWSTPQTSEAEALSKLGPEVPIPSDLKKHESVNYTKAADMQVKTAAARNVADWGQKWQTLYGGALANNPSRPAQYWWHGPNKAQPIELYNRQISDWSRDYKQEIYSRPNAIMHEHDPGQHQYAPQDITSAGGLGELISLRTDDMQKNIYSEDSVQAALLEAKLAHLTAFPVAKDEPVAKQLRSLLHAKLPQWVRKASAEDAWSGATYALAKSYLDGTDSSAESAKEDLVAWEAKNEKKRIDYRLKAPRTSVRARPDAKQSRNMRQDEQIASRNKKREEEHSRRRQLLGQSLTALSSGPDDQGNNTASGSSQTDDAMDD